jgi:hypothetical protein
VFLLPHPAELTNPSHKNYIMNDPTKFLQVHKASRIKKNLNIYSYHYKSKKTQFTLQTTTDKQRQYNPDIKRIYSLKTAGHNKENKNLRLLVQALPGRIQWPSMDYYTVKGEFLKQPICWNLPVQPQPIETDYNFSTRSPIKAFKSASTSNK